MFLNDPLPSPDTQAQSSIMKRGKLTGKDSLVVLKLNQCSQEFIKNNLLLLNLTLLNKIPEEIFAYFRLMRVL